WRSWGKRCSTGRSVNFTTLRRTSSSSPLPGVLPPRNILARSNVDFVGLAVDFDRGPGTARPGGRLDLAFPPVEGAAELPDHRGLVRGQVRCFADVLFQVEEPDIVAGLDELPVSFANGSVGTVTPEQDLVGRRGFFPLEVREQVNAVRPKTVGEGHGGGPGDRGQDVERADSLAVDSSAFEGGRPADDERDPDAAF